MVFIDRVNFSGAKPPMRIYMQKEGFELFGAKHKVYEYFVNTINNLNVLHSADFNYVLGIIGKELKTNIPIIDLFGYLLNESWRNKPTVHTFAINNGIYIPKAKVYHDNNIKKLLDIEEEHRIKRCRGVVDYMFNPPKLSRDLTNNCSML